MLRKNFSGRKEVKRREAEERNAAWQKLTPAEQLADLDKRFGVGAGAKKQRKRIAKLLV